MVVRTGHSSEGCFANTVPCFAGHNRVATFSVTALAVLRAFER